MTLTSGRGMGPWAGCDHARWSLVATCGVGDETVRTAPASLAALGVVREVT